MGPGVQNQMLTPNPEEVAPGGNAETNEAVQDSENAEASTDLVSLSPRHLRSAIMSMMSGNVENDQRQEDPVGALVREFQDLPSQYWPQRVDQIRQEYGNEMAQQVTSKLAEAQMLLLQQPDHLPARRDNFKEFPV